jgi:hypothetical protein
MRTDHGAPCTAATVLRCAHVICDSIFRIAKGGMMMRYPRCILAVPFSVILALAGFGIAMADDDDDDQPATRLDRKIDDHAQRTLAEGRQIFRFDTFGDEDFWGDTISCIGPFKASASAESVRV